MTDHPNRSAGSARLAALASRIAEIEPSWLPMAGHVRNVTFTLDEADLVILALTRPTAPAQPEKMPTSRPVAFRVPRVVDDKLSKTEFRLFDDEDEARRAACDIGADYDGLFLVADRRAAFFAQPDPRLSADNVDASGREG